MTYLQLINAVLRRLREDPVTSVGQSDYASLIGDFVNETKREVEDSWQWVQLRTTIQVTCEGDGSIFRYALTGAGNRFRILQVINDSEDIELRVAPYGWMNRMFTAISSGIQTGHPAYYDINGQVASTNDPYVDFFPVPDEADVINFNIVLPQDDLTDGTDLLIVPAYPIILGAYAKALSERGEDGGQQFGEVMREYDRALGDAIAADTMNVPSELIWEVV